MNNQKNFNRILFVALTITIFFFHTNAHAGACGSDKVKVGTKDKISCLPPRTCGALKRVADTFGSVTIVSGLRPAADNARRGGAKKSQHIHCKAADFLVPGHQNKATLEKLARLLAAIPGTRYNVYCTGRTHVDDSNLSNGYDTCLGGKKGKVKRKHISQRRATRRAARS